MKTDYNHAYNHAIAAHYAAYRPSLHSTILEKVLPEDPMFLKGLDVGCGTGYSTLALAKYCSNVIGIDPSQSMLDRATEYPNVKYVEGSGEEIPLPDDSIDIVTLAGSLFYINLNKAASEIRRVCRKEAVIIPYDFKIQLNETLALLGLDHQTTKKEYDHTVNFSGVDGFKEIVNKQDQINIECTGAQLAHLLLSDPNRYNRIAKKFETENPFRKLKESLIKSGNHFFVKANLFYSKYHLGEE
ncbi:MAG: class I SAM-dependent methyltransferase [Balneolaceae bacterium]|nr:class I SAM-dependent methyltransferase [Balneolaceae bacterium]